ncbi:hypothetical protein DSC45_05720 [Streptomyces sp. YIM 130001]|uniref:hypothetical protein n=1 Tax=Streptomyces sp. YIM 130001 TaxID=2259644 RepID=UPI000E658994|nr:hypothetical protein [Streptomyces sp. YIM 130001]RII19492.1 hypothetical protein DSC45_05720 [Streptomyces sp. YIM 130001]
MADEQPYPDPLTVAITGEPVPDGAREDEAYVLEHADAVRDLGLLRDQLQVVARELTGAETAGATEERAETEAEERHATQAPETVGAQEPPARPWWRPRNRRTLILRAATAVCGLAVFGTVFWLGPMGGADGGGEEAAKSATDTGAGGDGGGSGAQSPQAMVACSSLIVEGTVETVEELPGAGMDRITVKVKRYYKPADGGSRVVFPMDQNVDPRLKKGDRTLITIGQDDAAPENWAVGKDLADLRKLVVKALPGAAKTKCGT